MNRRGYDTRARSFQMALHEAAEGLANRSKLTDTGNPLAKITPQRECLINLVTCAVTVGYGKALESWIYQNGRLAIYFTGMHGSQQDPRRKEGTPPRPVHATPHHI